MAEALAPKAAVREPSPLATRLSTLPLAWIVAAGWTLACIGVGIVYGLPVAILAMTGGAILAVAWLGYRTAIAVLDSSTGVQLADVAVSPAQDRKRAALAALKDLEYERSIGNVTEEDYEQLLGRYREEAKRAMRLVDEERAELRARAEELLRETLDDADPREAPVKKTRKAEKAPKADKPKPAGRACPACEAANDADATFCKKCGKPLEARCAACQTVNDADATFCKKCGKPLATGDASKPAEDAKKKPETDVATSDEAGKPAEDAANTADAKEGDA